MASVISARTISSILFPLLSALCILAFFRNTPAITPYFTSVAERGAIDTPRGRFTLFTSFYGTKYLDEFWRVVVLAFIPSSFGIDLVSRGQMFSFLVDFGTVNAIWLLEACRLANEGTAIYYSGTFALLSQIIGGGTVTPLYYVAFLFTAPRAQTLTSETRKIDVTKARTLLISCIVAYFLPVLLAYHAPSLDTRHACTWLWQMYPIWIGISQLVLPRLFSHRHQPTGALEKSQTPQDVFWIRLTLVPLIAISASTWLYIRCFSAHGITSIFIPRVLSSSDALIALRTLLQWDYLTTFAATMVWLVYLDANLRAAGLAKLGSLECVIALAMLTVAVGPGAATGVAWLVREDMLVKGLTETSVKKAS